MELTRPKRLGRVVAMGGFVKRSPDVETVPEAPAEATAKLAAERAALLEGAACHRTIAGLLVKCRAFRRH